VNEELKMTQKEGVVAIDGIIHTVNYNKS